MSDVVQMRGTVRTEMLQRVMLSWACPHRGLRQKPIRAALFMLVWTAFGVMVDLDMAGLKFWIGPVTALFLCVASCLISWFSAIEVFDELMGQQGEGEAT
ncbi:hypothetical protein C1J03_04230 [Sulfitobacter sp. SK012]|uniref:hypothetical protein n=1 Tax=Sulfitobacter sp. SK012 TaxID=1389005 RepID=UPI000E0A08AC|nr:hypothetical protein [Sulfitobacter sp. SK012]AXI45314.1 hypothetical protein C1J03_04230 [Sulfitobacter sp. SK012]